MKETTSPPKPKERGENALSILSDYAEWMEQITAITDEQVTDFITRRLPDQEARYIWQQMDKTRQKIALWYALMPTEERRTVLTKLRQLPERKKLPAGFHDFFGTAGIVHNTVGIMDSTPRSEQKK